MINNDNSGYKGSERKRCAKKTQGFTILELMISMSIISIALVFLIGVFTTGLRANRKSVDLTAGTLVAEEIISQELYGILADADKSKTFFGEGSTTDTNKLYVQGTKYHNNTKFTYKMFISDVKNMGDKDNANKIKKVDVQVWWWNDEGQEPSATQESFRAGYGVVSVGLTRLVNQQSKF
ncbi:MAG: type II secretion system protein [bacterium]|nr:type II secretion system protein [bacterium]